MQNDINTLYQILTENGFSCELDNFNCPPILSIAISRDSKEKVSYIHLQFSPIESSLQQVRWLNFHYHFPITVTSNVNNRRNTQSHLTLLNKEIPFGKFILFRPAKKQTYLEHLKSIQAHSKHILENAPAPPTSSYFIRYEYTLAISAQHPISPPFFVEVVTTCQQLLLMYQEKLELWGWGRMDFFGEK